MTKIFAFLIIPVLFPILITVSNINVGTEQNTKFVSFLLILEQNSGFEELSQWLADISFRNFTFAVCGGLQGNNYWLDNSTRVDTLKNYGRLIPVTSFMASMKPEERESIVDQIIGNWIAKVGYSPKGFFDFQPDTYTLNYMEEKNISYVVGYCFDQYCIDRMTERGGWQLPYYAHSSSALRPNEKNSRGIVVFPHLCWDWIASFTVTHHLCTHPLALKEVFNGNMTEAEAYFYDLIDNTLEDCKPWGFVSVQFEWVWAGIDGQIGEYAKNWFKKLLNARSYRFWTYEDSAAWFEANYATTPDYSVNFTSPYNDERIEWYYCQRFRVARVNNNVVSYVQYHRQSDDPFLTSLAKLNLTSPSSRDICIDTSLNFTIDALGGGLYRNPVTDNAVAFEGQLELFPTYYETRKDSTKELVPFAFATLALTATVVLLLHMHSREVRHTWLGTLRVAFLGIKGFLVRNPGIVFIVGSQALLLTCAGLLIQGNPTLANDVAAYTYFLLIVGVILQALRSLRHENEGDSR